MRKNPMPVVLALLSIALPPIAESAAPAAPVTPPQAAAKPAHYSVEATLISNLIDDPAAAAVLKKLIPGVWGNEMFQTMGRDQTLRSVQQYEQELTNEKLAEIQAEFDKIPAR